jgi:hypothetical protein
VLVTLTQAGTPGTDDWFLLELANEMGANFPRLHKLRRYRTGDAPVPDEATPAMRDAYVRFIKMSRLNMCELIVGSKTNRMKPVGFRTAAAGDELGDDFAWETWNRSRMNIGARRLFADAGHYGDAFITVAGPEQPDADRTLYPSVLVRSDPWRTWSREHPRFDWVTEYAIEVSHDPIMLVDRIILYGMGWFRVAERPANRTTIPSDGSVWRITSDWTWVGERIALNWTAENPVTRYSTLTRQGIYEPHLDTIDRINDGIKQRSTLQAMQAFKQRGIRGDMPRVWPADHPEAGEPIDYDKIFEAGPAALWMLPAGAEIWESKETDLRPLLDVNKDDKKDLAAVTGTPLYILSPDAASGSAEGAASLKETANFTVDEMIDVASVTLSQAQSLGFQAQGDAERANAARIETIWASVDRLSMQERATAAQAAKQGGATQRYIDEKIFGMTPAEMRQAQQDRDDELLIAQVAA